MSAGAGDPVRVLVVDDEANLTELLSMAMRYEGWEIRTSHAGADAVRVAREFRPDAVVLDWMLPDFDGLEVLRRMRADGSMMSSTTASGRKSRAAATASVPLCAIRRSQPS